MKRMFQFLLSACVASMAAGEPRFYYAYGEKTKLTRDPAKAWLTFKDEIKDPGAQSASIEGDAKRKGKPALKITLKKTAFKEALAEVDPAFAAGGIEGLRGLDGIAEVMPVFTTEDALPMAIGKDICVKFKPGVTEGKINSVISSFGLQVVGRTFFHLVRVPESMDALEVANRLYETGLAEYSHPDFRVEKTWHQAANDSYFNFQWNFHNTGQVINDNHTGTPDADIDMLEAWRVSQGRANIIVAVLDEGVTANHPDLPNARQLRLPGSNFDGGGVANDPSPAGNNNHGNACAGLVAATRNNNQGVSGVAPNVTIMPIRMMGATVAGTANAFDFARNNGAHVLTNSWGYNSSNRNLHPVIRDAIIRATTLGRGGRGCVVAFAAGNTAHHAGNNAGYVSFPANVDVAGVLTVGASDRFDRQANYSPTSDLIDIVAPSHRAYPNQIAGENAEIWTIDIPGTPGYNPAGGTTTGARLPASGTNWEAYTGRFGGTSAACPQVAGVAALILGLRSNLTQQQVFNMLTQSTDRVGGYAYVNGRCNQMGFGRLNAFTTLRKTVGYLPELVSR